ncbi:MAG: bifunctional UDP-N-acetylglucosamine diphosphorylase/glucosamine-1-phosphate N-acetyltransferase GlmU [Pseudomonadota bacterium]
MSAHTEDRPLLSIVLAAGKGTRMRSATPKVLHEIGGRSMLEHVLALTQTVSDSRATHCAVVIGPDMAPVQERVQAGVPTADIFIQEHQAGTGDAVRAAGPVLTGRDGVVVVLFADTPLITPATVGRLVAAIDAGAQVAVLGFEAADPTGYGRLLVDDTAASTHEAKPLRAIREHKDATAQERAQTLCNAGIMAFSAAHLPRLLASLTNDNANNEFYLTDTVEHAIAAGLTAVAMTAPEAETMGVNTRVQLADAEAVFQARMREAQMLAGVTMRAPDTVYFSFDTILGQDCTLEPNVWFGPGVTLGDNVTVRANSHLEGAQVASGSSVGPFARLRPGARLAEGVKIGNFTEIKGAELGAGSKVPHLSYVGDATVGAGANIGAGTITCNYDGFFKHRTTIGDGAFIGSNSSLVAPVTIGPGAYVGSGSVISKNVAADDLSLARAEQSSRTGWAGKFRARMQRIKAERQG